MDDPIPRPRRAALGALAAAALAVLLAAPATAAPRTPTAAAAPALRDAHIVAAYHYLLARLLVLRQQQLDLQDGMAWNQLSHRDADATLGLAASDAWIAVDASSCTLLDLPPIDGRYHTVQVLNGWGDTLVNLNDRTAPYRRAGRVAFCARGAHPPLPPGTPRIELPGGQARLRIRIALGGDAPAATELQRRIILAPTGTPAIALPPPIPAFSDTALPGAEAFEQTEALLAGAPDIEAGMDAPRAAARQVAAALADPTARARIDAVIRAEAIPQLHTARLTFGTQRDGWSRPATVGTYGGDYLSRSLVAFTDLWANVASEVVAFTAAVDGDGQPLDGSTVYRLTFPAGQHPDRLARYFWSLAAIDAQGAELIDTAQPRLPHSRSGPEPDADGALTLVLAAALPAGVPESNWLPTPAGRAYRLALRFYGPSPVLQAGQYFPPPLRPTSPLPQEEGEG